MRFVIYSSELRGVAGNCFYPKRVVVEDQESFIEAVKNDHVCAEYKSNYRNAQNFMKSCCLVMDIDNDHSENEKDWVTEEDIHEAFRDVDYVLATSRNHMKSKNGKRPRPKFHIYFAIAPCESAEQYTQMKVALAAKYDFFDHNALDAARFLFGSDVDSPVWNEGWLTVTDLIEGFENEELTGDDFSGVIEEGGRNNAMSRFASRILKKYGETERARSAYLQYSQKCSPPLDDVELESIWKSAARFYNAKVKTSGDYISPEDYNDDFEDWMEGLRYDKKGNLSNCLHNINLIMKHDEAMQAVVFNELADSMEVVGDVPWHHEGRFWRDADDAQLISYIDEKYGTFSARNYDIAVTKAADDRSYHPIKSYFNGLPSWDGKERAETILIDYLGAENTPYVRAVTRKILCAAYKRILVPGIKFDYMVVLNGAQGIGKSTLISKLGMAWFSDSLSLSDMNDKTAAEKLQGYWILEIGELAGMKKADLDKVKAFISRQDDKYRASFGRRVTPHPRQCVFFGTTNTEDGYLRDITGNRRYWNVTVTGNGKHKPWELDTDTVDQIWAEVKVLTEKGEKLFLNTELEVFAEAEQKAAMEKDDREGIVEAYLEMLLPEMWDEMSIYDRREYAGDKDDPTRACGVSRRETVCNMEIWCECFGKAKEDMRPSDAYTIASIMKSIDGWEKTGRSMHHPIYGRQRVYERTR